MLKGPGLVNSAGPLSDSFSGLTNKGKINMEIGCYKHY